MSSQTKLYVGNISSRSRPRDVEDAFDRFGRLRSCDLLNGFAFVEFEDRHDAKDAQKELDGHSMDGREWTVEFAKGPGQVRGRDGGVGGSNVRGGSVRGRRENCVVVKDLGSRVSWQDLKDWGRNAGSVEYADVWQEGSRKYGVIKYDSKEDFKNALRKLEDYRLAGEYVRVEADEDAGESRRSSSRSRSRSRSRDRDRDRGGDEPRREERRDPSRSPRRERSRSPPRR